MAIPDPATTDWVPIWHPESAGAQGPPGATGPIGPQGPAGVNGTAAPHQTTHQVGGTDELVNNAWKDRDNNFTIGQHINTPNANIVLNDTGAPVDNKIFRILSGGGTLYIDALNDAQNAVQGEVFITRNGSIHSDGGISAVGGFAGPNYNFISPVDVVNPTVLDHYEEGTWSPTIAFDGGNPTGQTYNIQQGLYTRIGRVIICNFDVQIGSPGTGGGGSAYIGGLPIVNGPVLAAGLVANFLGLNESVITITLQLTNGLNSALLVKKVTASSSNDGVLSIGSIIAGSRIIGALTYQVLT